MSPEQLRSTSNVDTRTDIWALGVVLYELLSGQVPFEAESVAEVCALVLGSPPRPIEAERRDVPGCASLIGIEDGVPDPGTSGTDATTNDAGSNDANDASTGADTSPTPDAALTPSPLGAPGGTVSTLPCGAEMCAIPGQSCCAYRSSSQNGVYTGTCAATCAPPGPGTDRVDVFKCSGAANCPAAMPRCCLPISGSSASSTCRPTCNLQSEVLLCDPNEPNTCGGASCRHFTGMTLPPTWGYCN